MDPRLLNPNSRWGYAGFVGVSLGGLAGTYRWGSLNPLLQGLSIGVGVLGVYAVEA